MKHLIGKKVKILHHAKGPSGEYILREVEHGVVVNTYKHIFRVRIGNHYECFRYHELTGNETTQVKVKGE